MSELPQGWDERALINLADYHNGAAFKPKDWEEDGLPIIRIEQINNPSAETDKFGGFVQEANLIDSGDLIFSWSATLKVVIWRDGPAVLNQHLFKVVPKTDVNKKLLRQILDFNMEKLAGQSQGSTMKHVTRKELSKFRVALPKEPNHQKRIAAILETVDEAIEQTEALIGKYEQVKAGMMQDLLTRGMTPDGKLRPSRDKAPGLYQETPIGWIPKDWDAALLDTLADRRSGHTPSKSHPDYWNGGVKWVSLADSYRLDKLYISDTDNQISALGLQNSSAVLLPADTVIMSRDAGVGKSAILGESMAVSQHFMAWVCGEKIDALFLYYWLQFKKRMFENIAMGSTILTIGLPYFKKMKIGAPIDVAEQCRIAGRLRQVDANLNCEKDHLQKLRQQKSGLMQDLLTGKVPVKV